MRVLCLLFLVHISWLRGQEQIPSYLQGQLLGSSLDLSNIHVVNQSRGTATITDAQGAFEIAAAAGDQLYISAVQILTRKIIVSQAMLDRSRIDIPVEPFVNQLDEVVVSPYALSGRLTNDSRQAPKAKSLNFDDLGIPGYKGIRKEKIKTVGQMALDIVSLKLDVEALYNHLSGYYKRLRKKRALDHKFELVLEMIQFYGLHFLMEQFQLPEDQVYEFALGALENYPIEEKFTKGAHAAVLEMYQTYYQDYQPTE